MNETSKAKIERALRELVNDGVVEETVVNGEPAYYLSGWFMALMMRNINKLLLDERYPRDIVFEAAIILSLLEIYGCMEREDLDAKASIVEALIGEITR